MIPTFIRAYEAAAEVAPNTIIGWAAPATSSSVAPATGGTASLVGVADAMGAVAGGMCDVMRGGLVPVKLGGPVAAGDPITANATAQGIKATAGDHIIGTADQPGVAGDIIDVFFAPGVAA